MSANQQRKPRTFEISPATRQQVPLLIGLDGPSGSGKTYSMLELLTGVQTITGGDIAVLDSEARRALHYADKFKFHHVPFTEPFGSLDYLDALQYLGKKGYRAIGVDSMSHEHEGVGGLLELHDQELERLTKGDEKREGKMGMLAWKLPKANRRRLINGILQIPANFVFCFRAKEKIRIETGKDPVKLGWMPIAGEELVFEMTINALLTPGSNGVPSWNPNALGERATVKLPSQFRQLFSSRRPLDAETGAALARWAAGGAAPGLSAQAARGGDRERGDIRKDMVRMRSALGWSPERFAEWITGAFGPPKDLTMQQLEDARTVMGLWQDIGEEDAQAELEVMIELGRAKALPAAAAAQGETT